MAARSSSRASAEISETLLHEVDASRLPLRTGETVDDFVHELFPVIFDPTVLPKRVNKADGEDLVQTSACNFYDGVTQQEAESFYQQQKEQPATTNAAPVPMD